MARLKLIFGNPICTEGNAPGMNDDGTAAQIFTNYPMEKLMKRYFKTEDGV
ncbi:hypothetical protein REC12_06560 [Desulfosporosinus sp. PR]|uniref:hypothetical protein n=1 Tax=Candidatus Desulfosporosinus nitrosoreducens TaxID=3401928 RepID=UPI0027E7057D|nr:hypothetical protein [Desulfosporosinus sp. PR]MDQ7093246.1 hypothetical protein [Desulfosporosinus sp. PR]